MRELVSPDRHTPTPTFARNRAVQSRRSSLKMSWFNLL
jgi:hypothetical protein